jgi:hypothetical protein
LDTAAVFESVSIEVTELDARGQVHRAAADYGATDPEHGLT